MQRGKGEAGRISQEEIKCLADRLDAGNEEGRLMTV